MTPPHIMALRYRIWAYCEPRGWDVTHREVADALGLDNWRTVTHAIAGTSWPNKMRTTKSDGGSMPASSGANYLAGQQIARDISQGRVGFDPTAQA
jgi:hypothetical protein